MRFVIIVLIIAVLAIIGLFGYGLTLRPDTHTIEQDAVPASHA
ncbi:MAG: hypothetical protein R3C60_14050 [Parvularculaceae bacterium]